MAAGYSHRRAAEKLGVKAGSCPGVIDADEGWDLDGTPEDVVVRTSLRGGRDVTIAFVRSRRHLKRNAQRYLSQQHRFFHGGVVATLADVCGGYAAFTMLPPDLTNVTVEFKLSLLAPAKGDQLLAEAAVLNAGRTLTVCQSDVFGIAADQSRAHCATSLATYMAIDRTSRATPTRGRSW